MNSRIALGMYLGYPICCIEEFDSSVSQNEAGELSVLEYVAMIKGRPLHGTGFVPCLMCSATYTDEELIAKINAIRCHDKPFPSTTDADLKEKFDHWLKNLAEASDDE